MATELSRIFPGDDKMSRLCREFDWASTSLGPPDQWPGSLCALVGEIRGVRVVCQETAAQVRAEQEATEWETEVRFRLLAESMPQIVWTALPNGEVDYQTRAVLDYTGKTPDELRGEKWLDVLHPDDVEPTVEAWTHSVTTGEVYEVQFRIRRCDGEYRWFLTRAVCFRGKEGEIERWFGTSTDIHDQLAIQEGSRRLSERLTKTLESITDAFYLLDREWRFRFVNSEAARAMESDPDVVLGSVIWEGFPATVGTEIEVEYRRAMESGETAAFRYFYAPFSRWFDIRAYPSSEGLAVYFRDVTAEREAHLRLKEQAELLERAQDAILVRKLDHTIDFWNASAERIYGWSPKEAIGRSVAELLYSDTGPFHAATAKVLERGEWTGELEHRCKDGKTLIVEGRWSLVRGEDGEPARILAINTDVTDRKKLLVQFLRAQRMESIGTLAGGIAHDLNNVLAPILLSIGMLKADAEDPDTREILNTIEASAQRGADMVRQVLAFARGIDGAQITVDLPRILGDLKRISRDTFPRNIELRITAPETLRRVVGDPTQVHQVLMNLLLNARDATAAHGGVIEVVAENVELDDHYVGLHEVATPGAHVKLSVSDSGEGMDAETLSQIFDPFFTTKEVGSGTGLGLSTVQAIVRSHGGFVSVYSEPGRGSTFRVYLPAAEAADVPEEARRAPELRRGKGELILVVDDEIGVRAITQQTLEAFGYRVVTATDGADAVGVYGRRGNEIDLVLTDIMMPIMDGPIMVRALRRINPDVRVVAASGLGPKGEEARAAEWGVRHFLPKPYTAEILLRTIGEALEEAIEP